MALTGLQKFDLLKDCIDVTELSSITIDGTTITGYFNYYFLNTKTYNKTPSRSIGGVIKNLNNYTTFLTPKLKIYFNYLAFSEYQKIMEIIQSKNEHTVSFYDIEKGKTRTANMYFSTEDYPELVLGWGKLHGVKGYTIELIGTNTSTSNVSITYHLNPVDGSGLSDETYATKSLTAGTEVTIGDSVKFYAGSTSTTSASEITYPVTTDSVIYQYYLYSWNTKADGSGMNYFNDATYFVLDDIVLYAVWKAVGE